MLLTLNLWNLTAIVREGKLYELTVRTNSYSYSSDACTERPS